MCAVPAAPNNQPRHAATSPPALHSRYNPCPGRHNRTPMQQVHAWMPDGPLLALHAIPTVSGTAPALEFTRAAGSRGSTRLSSRRPGQQQPTIRLSAQSPNLPRGWNEQQLASRQTHELTRPASTKHEKQQPQRKTFSTPGAHCRPVPRQHAPKPTIRVLCA